MSLRIFPTLKSREEVIQAFLILMGPIKVQPGCIEVKIFQNIGEVEIRYEELWNTRDSLENHIRSDHFSQILRLMEISAVEPTLTFSDVNQPRSIEYVEEVRRQKK